MDLIWYIYLYLLPHQILKIEVALEYAIVLLTPPGVYILNFGTYSVIQTNADKKKKYIARPISEIKIFRGTTKIVLSLGPKCEIELGKVVFCPV